MNSTIWYYYNPVVMHVFGSDSVSKGRRFIFILYYICYGTVIPLLNQYTPENITLYFSCREDIIVCVAVR
jgi:hypothetical protein